MVTPEGGCRALIREIERGVKGEAEVVLGEGPWGVASAPASRSSAGALPLFVELLPTNGTGEVDVTRVLDPAVDLYLVDHQLDGKPVFPAAMAVELMAEVAHQRWPDRRVVGIRSFRLLTGVLLDNGLKPVRVIARADSASEERQDELTVEVRIEDPDSGRICYQASVILADRFPPAPVLGGTSPGSALRPFPMSVESAYDQWLFHGPLFQCIESIEGMDEGGITATIVPSSPRRLIKGTSAERWLFDPVVVDGAFQLTLLYARASTGMTPLPARFERLRVFSAMNGSRLRCDIRARTGAGGHSIETQTTFLDGDGRLVALLENAEFNASQKLNRLGGTWIRRGTKGALDGIRED